MIKGIIFDLYNVVVKDDRSNKEGVWNLRLLTPDDLTDGFLVFLKELKNKGIQVAIVSDEMHLKDILDRLRITHLINVYLSDSSFDTEPVSLYQEAASLMNLLPSEIILFKNDKRVEALQHGGFRIIGVGNGDGDQKRIRRLTDFSSLKFNELVASFSDF
jgi:beta-phosphoglucomutase-like phosphatase (HAD superfamily)